MRVKITDCKSALLLSILAHPPAVDDVTHKINGLIGLGLGLVCSSAKGLNEF